MDEISHIIPHKPVTGVQIATGDPGIRAVLQGTSLFEVIADNGGNQLAAASASDQATQFPRTTPEAPLQPASGPQPAEELPGSDAAARIAEFNATFEVAAARLALAGIAVQPAGTPLPQPAQTE